MVSTPTSVLSAQWRRLSSEEKSQYKDSRGRPNFLVFKKSRHSGVASPLRSPPTPVHTASMNELRRAAARCLPERFVMSSVQAADAACVTSKLGNRAYRHRDGRTCCKELSHETLHQQRLRTLRLTRGVLPDTTLRTFLRSVSDITRVTSATLPRLLDAAARATRGLLHVGKALLPFVFTYMVLVKLEDIGRGVVVPAMGELRLALETYHHNRILEFIELLLRVGTSMLPGPAAARAAAVLAQIPHGDTLLRSMSFFVARVAQMLPTGGMSGALPMLG